MDKRIIKVLKIFINELFLKQRINQVRKSEIKIKKLKLKLKEEERLYEYLLINNLDWINKRRNKNG